MCGHCLFPNIVKEHSQYLAVSDADGVAQEQLTCTEHCYQQCCQNHVNGCALDALLAAGGPTKCNKKVTSFMDLALRHIELMHCNTN